MSYSTTRPAAITATWSALRASAVEWVIRMVVRPSISRFSPAITSVSLAASRPVVGSSSTRIGGSRSSTRAIPIRCR